MSEVRRAAADKYDFSVKARTVRNALSTPAVLDGFRDLIRGLDRAALAYVLACSVKARNEEGYLGKYAEWAEDVAGAFRSSMPSAYSIEDNLDPSRIGEYAGKWIELNSD